MCRAICSRTPSSTSGTSARKRPATETRASWGQGWNQSMTVLLISAGKLRALTRSASPAGLKQSTTCRFLRTFSMKKSHSTSGLSTMPVALTSLRTELHIPSRSSGVIRSGMLPLLSRSLM